MYTVESMVAVCYVNCFTFLFSAALVATKERKREIYYLPPAGSIQFQKRLVREPNYLAYLSWELKCRLVIGPWRFNKLIPVIITDKWSALFAVGLMASLSLVFRESISLAAAAAPPPLHFLRERARQSQHKERVGFIESQSVSVEAAAARCVAAGKPPQQQRHEPLCSSALSASCEVGGHEAGRCRRDSALCRIRKISTQDQEQKSAARQILRAQEGVDRTQIWYFTS
jgi:hypothetical protein